MKIREGIVETSPNDIGHARKIRAANKKSRFGEIFLNEGEPVSPGFPAVLNPPSENQSVNRPILARWLVNPENPLTARVLLNRFWELHFGNGLVKTMEDFGSQERPHPELLDWLAYGFIAGCVR